MSARLVLGRDAVILRETAEGIELDGRVRLRPGSVVDVVPAPGVWNRSRGFALVWTWRLRAVGSAGPIYRGLCRWHPPPGNELPAPSSDAIETTLRH